VGISGASGAAYALRLLELLVGGGHEVHCVISEYGKRLLFDEAGVRGTGFGDLCPRLDPDGQPGDFAHPLRQTRGASSDTSPARGGGGAADAAQLVAPNRERLICHPHKDVGAVIASGSFLHDGMVVIPCSSASLGAMATGSGSNLLTRAAMVTLKERRPLIVCHRETPLSLIDIENMRTLALAGAVVCPTNPGFYLGPKRVEDLVDFMVGKVLDLLKVEHGLATRWEGRGSGGGA
jgi:4-hydroxy-3-polyprenylbenzoate decarboxylase